MLSSCVQECPSSGLFGSFCSVDLLLFGAFLDSARMNGDCVLALLAADWAAPGKLAGAALHHLSPARSVAWSAAHQLTAIWCQSRGSWVCFRGERRHFSAIFLIDYVDCVLWVALTVTSPTSSPRDTVVRVEIAEIWRGSKVQKVSGSGGFDLGVTGEQGCPGSDTSQANLRGRGCCKG